MNGYDLMMSPLENSFLKEFRQKFGSYLSGRVLEIGTGTGVNLDYYPLGNIDELVLSDRSLDQALYSKLERLNNSSKIKTSEFSVETIPYDDHSFDYIIATLVFCSVDSVELGLNEIKRVLKPDGKYIFIEHVLPSEQPKAFIFDKITPLWKRLAQNCHLNRDFVSALQNAGFRVKERDYKLGTVFLHGVAESVI